MKTELFMFMSDYFLCNMPSDQLLISLEKHSKLHSKLSQSLGQKPVEHSDFFLLCSLFSTICKVAECPQKHGGYHFTGPFHSDNLHLSAKGEITQGIYHQKEQKSEGHYNVITSYSADPKVPEIEYCRQGSGYTA